LGATDQPDLPNLPDPPAFPPTVVIATPGRYVKLVTFPDMLGRYAKSKPKGLHYIVLAAIFLAFAGPADAQIYSWRDAAGHLVLSDRPLGTVEHTYAVPQVETVRVTRPAPAAHDLDYDELIVEHARLNAVRPDLVRAVVQVESAFNPGAKSPKGAIGLMQLMPATIRQFRVRDAFNPRENVRAGVAYLRQLLDRYDNDEQLALAAYNAGPGAVDRHGQNIPPYRETREYVSKINGLAAPPVQVHDHTIYKTLEIVGGRPVTKYTDHKPTSGSYEVVGR
jgi:soluble lytic murein transglycosylase-like protein